MREEPRTVTLREYLDLVRRHRRLIIVVAVLAAAASLVHATLTTPVYVATAELVVRSDAQDLELVGQPLPLVEAQVLTRSEVARRVQAALRSGRTPAQLVRAVDTQVDAAANTIELRARASSSRQAALIANAFAREGERLSTEILRARFAAGARSLRERLDALGEGNSTTRVAYAERVARLDFLSQFADRIDITQAAVAPAGPTSPKPIRNTFLAAVLGLIVGTALAFVRNAVDTRLRGSNELVEELGYPLVGHLRDEALGTSPVSGGRNRAMEDVDLEAMRILRSNVEFLDPGREVRTIAVTSAVPEEGKSTVACALASVCASVGRRTLLVECDLRRPVLAARLGMDSSPGLGDFLLSAATPQEVLRIIPATTGTNVEGVRRQPDAAEWQKPEAGTEPSERPETPEAGEPRSPAEAQAWSWTVIPAGQEHSRPYELLASPAFRSMLEQVREVYDVVILDTPPLLSVSDTRELIPLVDGVLLCVRASHTAREAAFAAAEALRRFPPRPTGLVVTGTRPGRDEDSGHYEYRYPAEAAR